MNWSQNGGICPMAALRFNDKCSHTDVELDSNYHLLSDCCVVSWFKMLTYWRVRSAFEPPHALLSNKTWQFESNSK